MGWDGILGAGWRKPETKHTTQPPVRQPAALQRINATAVSSPPAASPQVKHAAPAAGGDTIVRTKLEKYGGAIAPDVTDQVLTDVVVKRPGAAPEPEAPASDATTVKTHTRKPPQPTTLEVVLEQFRLYELRPLSIGKFCAEWLAHQPELPADQQLPRSEALKRIRTGLAQQDQVTLAARLDRFIACYWIATELGWTSAWKLRYAAIRELLPLFGRNAATEEYCLRPDKAEATRALWNRMLDEHLTAIAVRDEVRKIRPPKAVRMHGRSGKLAAVRREMLRIVARLKDRGAVLEWIRLGQERLDKLGLGEESPIGTKLPAAG
jgi:hypothetical protein